jgi:hypothetical protein
MRPSARPYIGWEHIAAPINISLNIFCLFILVDATLKTAFGITFSRNIRNFRRSILKTYFQFAVVFHIKRTETCDPLGPRLSGILHGVGRWFFKLTYKSSVIEKEINFSFIVLFAMIRQLEIRRLTVLY